ncbi:Cytochrome c oxidase subunit 6A, mitochondrial [Hypsizygus marmoreus]|uniref:Cytochrome c oxidase subunit 6A, mitochondrial n=1 Tax=Hypsizygus marmoreus TaxID=39966 RepID=A0A369K5N8_HYPMA|nr:Cytochrome c oxidase subunit 6A, mitochondrial [Hypsizygus marmoreus]
MSLLARNAIRAAGRSSRQVRSYSSTQAYRNYIAEQEALSHHATDTTNLWRKISYFVCVPAIAVCVAWVYNAEAEHKHHLDHLRAEHDGHLPEGPAYEYLNRRGKPFPWGMNSLFFNPHSNKDLTSQ